MSIFKDKVVILRSVNFGEADKILTVFGEKHGKISLIAKGIRKIASKNRGNMQTLSVSNISFFRNSGMGVLTETQLITPSDYPLKCFKNIERVLFLLYKLIDEDEKDELIFKELLKVLDSNFSDEMVNRFRMFFLWRAGFIGDYRFCSKCKKSVKKESDFIKNDTLEMFCGGCIGRKEDVIKLDSSQKTMMLVIDNFVRKLVER